MSKIQQHIKVIKDSLPLKLVYLLSLSLILVFIFALPKPLFNNPTCTVINDNRGKLLAAQIATDGQWRFPEMDTVPEKFKQCIAYFEDQYFQYHPGVNPVSIFRALKQNIKAGKNVSGGSTINAQVIRLSRKGKPRNIGQKFIEFFLALRLEAGYSKSEILALYASHAPFGSNVVGLDAAAWRYYSRPADALSWGESATLAVLPNAPSLIYPGKNQELLLKKRNRLLDKLYKNKILDATACELAKLEPLPERPRPLPQLASHLLTRAISDGLSGQRITTTVDTKIQDQVNRIIEKHYQVLSENGVLNAAALVLDVETGNALAYVGNTQTGVQQSGQQVDIITAPRSTGSTLKPLLYALMQKEGLLLPGTLIADIPTHIAGFAPRNFDKEYDGAVHANNALSRSLNIPAVRMLQEYGVERFYHQLKDLNISTLTYSADHYGLSLILGGAEITLWELAGTYATLARVLNHYSINNSRYNPADYHKPAYILAKHNTTDHWQDTDPLGAGAIWVTFNALTEMHRPIENANWQLFTSSKKIAWKTGTSFGNRDAWAVGITSDYVVAVWIGNADGEGRSGLTGASTAAPVMFDIFKELPNAPWFETPYDDLVKINVCAKSGYKASELCTETDSIYVSQSGIKTGRCPYHKLIHLTADEKYRVTSDCYPISKMVTKSWFVLPPVMEWYYKYNDPFYQSLPPFHADCMNNGSENMEVIYPKNKAKLFLPIGFNQQQQLTVFEVAHRIPGAKVHWHLDHEFIGTTTGIHKKELFCRSGQHSLTLVDEFGEIQVVAFEVVE